MKPRRNHTETISETAQRNRETIPYVHPKRFRAARARAAHRSERAVRGSARFAALTLRYASAGRYRRAKGRKNPNVHCRMADDAMYKSTHDQRFADQTTAR
jgi:hypothetical protein